MPMKSLQTSYLGLTLKSPVIVGSSGLTNSIENIKEYEKQGAGAVVLKSLFEEQINFDTQKNLNTTPNYMYPEAIDYIKNYTKSQSVDTYLKLIAEAKNEVKIPIIASINCVSTNEWIDFTKKIEAAGADAIELNAFVLPSNDELSADQHEQFYFDLIEKVRKITSLPIALKMSYYSSGLAHLIKKLSWTKNVDAFVLFNRYYSPDIDVDTLKIQSTNVFSTTAESAIPMRWVGILSGKIETNIAASTGIHTGKDAVKQILAGADAVQIASVLYKNANAVGEIVAEMLEWMEKKKYNNISDFKGLLSQNKTENSAAYERVQFMKYFAGIE